MTHLVGATKSPTKVTSGREVHSGVQFRTLTVGEGTAAAAGGSWPRSTHGQEGFSSACFLPLIQSWIQRSSATHI